MLPWTCVIRLDLEIKLEINILYDVVTNRRMEGDALDTSRAEITKS